MKSFKPNTFVRQAFFLLLLLSPINNLVAQVIHISATNNNLYRLDLTDCSYEFMVNIQYNVFDISFHPNGELYGISGDGTFYEIDTLTGATSPIYTFLGQTYNSLTIAGDGTVYTIGDTGDLWSFNITSGEATLVGNIGYFATGDLTFFEGKLYVAVTDDRIVLINLDRPVNSSVVLTDNIQGEIFGIVSYAASCSEVYSYAITNGNSQIYQINFESNSLKFLCGLDIEVGGGASTFEFRASSPLNITDIITTNTDCTIDNGTLTVEASTDNGPISYAIDAINFQASPSFTGLSAGNYRVAIRDENGCEKMEEIQIFEDNAPTITAIEARDASCGENNGSLSITAESETGMLNYSIDGITFQAHERFDNLFPATYNIKVTDQEECSTQTTATIGETMCPVYIPNAFSPDNDGINDYFKVFPHPKFQGTFKSFRVFNRWGELVYQALDFDPFTTGWDGTFRGKSLDVGVYVFMIELERQDGVSEAIEGDIHLLKKGS